MSPRRKVPCTCAMCGDDLRNRRVFRAAATPVAAHEGKVVNTGTPRDVFVCSACYLDLSEDEVTK